MTSRIPFVILALVVLIGHLSLIAQTTDTFNGFQYVDKTGNIRNPADFRDRHELLGTWSVADPTGNQYTTIETA